MLVGAAKEVSAEATGHQGSRIVTAVQQPWIGRRRFWVSSWLSEKPLRVLVHQLVVGRHHQNDRLDARLLG